MPALKIYDLFLSHVWRSSQNGEYYRLVRLLRSATYFRWRNYSVPQHDPLGTKTDAQLRRALDRQIVRTNCFLVIAGMYVNGCALETDHFLVDSYVAAQRHDILGGSDFAAISVR